MTIHDRAKQMAAQSKTPTTVREQLQILARRGRAKYGRATVARTLERTQVETPKHYWWNREDAP